MTNDDGRKLEGAQEPSSKARVGAPSGVDGNGPKRFSVQRMAIVARLLRGEPLELVARETNVSIARLTEWREPARVHAHENGPDKASDGDPGQNREFCFMAIPLTNE
jgi:hypothetical protein